MLSKDQPYTVTDGSISESQQTRVQTLYSGAQAQLSFVQRYKDTLSGKIRTVHTINRIEGSWKFAKDHFRKINGAKISTFEAHLCEIIWRNRVVIAHHDTIISFFNLVKSHLSLRRQPNLETVRVPLFDSWSATSMDRVRREEVDDPRTVPEVNIATTTPPITRTVQLGIHEPRPSEISAAHSVMTKLVHSPPTRSSSVSSSVTSPVRILSPSSGRSKGKKKS